MLIYFYDICCRFGMVKEYFVMGHQHTEAPSGQKEKAANMGIRKDGRAYNL